jgi:hypothetical protein
MSQRSRGRRVLVVLGFIVAAAAAGIGGYLLESATGQEWTRYLPMAVVVTAAVLTPDSNWSRTFQKVTMCTVDPGGWSTAARARSVMPYRADCAEDAGGLVAAARLVHPACGLVVAVADLVPAGVFVPRAKCGSSLGCDCSGGRSVRMRVVDMFG